MACVINGIDVNTCIRVDILQQMLKTLQPVDTETRSQKSAVRARLVQLQRKAGGHPKDNEEGAQKKEQGGGRTKNFASEADFVKQSLLIWVQNKTCGYHGVNVKDFSKSWADGMAFAALVHHYAPDRVEIDKHSAETRRKNFEVAFKAADDAFGVYPLLDVNDMCELNAPDWKSVFAYVQLLYQAMKGKDPEV